jgi:hypothetical protein
VGALEFFPTHRQTVSRALFKKIEWRQWAVRIIDNCVAWGGMV